MAAFTRVISVRSTAFWGFVCGVATAGSDAAANTSVGSISLPFGHPSDRHSYPHRPGFTLWLVEEFDEPLDLDTDPIWTWSDGGLGEGQVRFVKDAIKFEDGKMVLEVNHAEEHPDAQQPCSHAEVGIVASKPLTSGEMRTRYNMFRYGYYEVSMKAPSVQPNNTQINGNYVSTMFCYRDAKFKHWREIDIEVTGGSPSGLTMNVLSAENTAMWNPWIQETGEYMGEDMNARTEFHTFAFEWLPTGITWYLNGQEVGHHGPEDRLAIPELSTKIMMNLWIFNTYYAFGGAEGVNNQYPMRSEYDWFRFYKWDGDEHYPCANMSTTCLTDSDWYLAGNNPCDGIPQRGTVYGADPCVATCTATEESSAAASEEPEGAPKEAQDYLSNFVFP